MTQQYQANGMEWNVYLSNIKSGPEKEMGTSPILYLR